MIASAVQLSLTLPLPVWFRLRRLRKADMPLLQPVLQSRIDAILSHVDDVVPIESIGAWLQESAFSRVWVFDRFMGKLEAVIP
jgi:hypothetical protein